MSKSVEGITKLHIYEFDGCLFETPIPNREILSTNVLDLVLDSDFLRCGGWFDWTAVLDNCAVMNTDDEKPGNRNWTGWWNKDVVELAKLSHGDDSTMSVLISHRIAKFWFRRLIKEMVSSESLDFGEFFFNHSASLTKTVNFKSSVLKALRRKYHNATEVTIYECGAQLPLYNVYLASYGDLLEELRVLHPDVGFQVYGIVNTYRNLDPVIEWDIVDCALKNHNHMNHTSNLKRKKERLRDHAGYVSYSPRIKHEVCYQILPGDLPSVSQLAMDLWKEKLGPNTTEGDLDKPQFFGDRILVSDTSMPIESGKMVRWTVTSIVRGKTFMIAKTDMVSENDSTTDIPEISLSLRPAHLVLLVVGSRSLLPLKEILASAVWEELPVEKTVTFSTKLLQRHSYDVERP